MTSILHVSEAYGGGIVTSINSFASNTPEFEHHLLVSEREDDKICLEQETTFSSVSKLPAGNFARIRAIGLLAKKLDVSFVHLHSSFAGVYGRLSRISRKKIIYSPHGFAFDRTSEPMWKRRAYFIVESILSFRQSGFIGVSPYEVACAEKMSSMQRTTFVPNSVPDRVEPLRSFSRKNRKVHLVCVGRLSAQKDPDFLLKAYGGLPSYVKDGLEITWIGGGNIDEEDKLTEQGIKVLGWVKYDLVQKVLRKADVYVHTAAWEGFPMSIVEAAVAGCPVLLRNIPSYAGINFAPGACVETHQQLTNAMLAMHENSFDWNSAIENSNIVRAMCTSAEQKKKLLQAYST